MFYRYATPKHFDYEDLERKYWKNIIYGQPIYGADVSGTLTDPDVTAWNINKLGTILDHVSEDYGVSSEFKYNMKFLCIYNISNT